MAINTSLELLDWRIKPGLFIAGGGGCPYRVFWTPSAKFAVRLAASDAGPAFSFERLTAKPLGAGLWLGPVILRIGEPSPYGSYGMGGLVIAARDRYFLKVADHTGSSTRLQLATYRAQSPVSNSVFYRDWSLISKATGRDVTLFDSADTPPVLQSYSPMETVEQHLKLVWDNRR